MQDAALCDAVQRARNGSINADLGGVIKQRIARKAGGKSRGFRAITLFRRGELAFFVHGFAKSNRENLRPNELGLGRRLGEWDDYRGDMP